jgi:hypothetical protein
MAHQLRERKQAWLAYNLERKAAIIKRSCRRLGDKRNREVLQVFAQAIGEAQDNCLYSSNTGWEKMRIDQYFHSFDF